MSSKRLDKFDDRKIEEQIALVQQVCANVNPETISEILQECDYDINQTIARIHSGDFQDSGWQPAKTTHRKKPIQQHSNEIPTRTNPPVAQLQRRSPSKIEPVTIVQSLPPSNSTSDPPAIVEKISPIRTETSNVVVERKQRRPSKPVTVYRAFQLSTFPSEIRFGDIQWNDDGPFVETPNDFITEQQLSSTTDFIPQTDLTTKQNENSSVELSSSISEQTTNASLNPTYLPTNETTPPPFVPYQAPTNQFPSNSPEYSNATAPMTWTNPINTYNKSTSKSSTNYSAQQPMYHHLGNYTYPTTSSMYPIVVPYDPWTNNGYNQTMDTYSYATANYVPTNYSNQQHFYSQQKYDPTTFEREFMTNVDPSLNSNSSGKDGPLKSRLSATATSFPGPSYSLPQYSYSTGHAAPSYSPNDTRDHHRATGPYGNNSTNHRSSYYAHRTYPNNNNNNNWHSQQ